MDKIRRIFHPKLRPFHFQIKTYYLSDANYPKDNPSQTHSPSLVRIKPKMERTQIYFLRLVFTAGAILGSLAPSTQNRIFLKPHIFWHESVDLPSTRNRWIRSLKPHLFETTLRIKRIRWGTVSKIHDSCGHVNKVLNGEFENSLLFPTRLYYWGWCGTAFFHIPHTPLLFLLVVVPYDKVLFFSIRDWYKHW